MEITCISDTHGQHKKLKDIPPCDVLIFAGDMMSSGYDVNEIISFNVWIGKQAATHKLVIAGNHDRMWQKEPSHCKSLLSNATYLEDSGVTIDGIKFWGSPYTPTFYDWAFMRNRGPDIQKHWDMIPEDTDVLITHGPPYGILDTTSIYSQEHLGCLNLTSTLLRVKPKLHIFGHIHGGHGIKEADYGILCNASLLNESYDLVYPPTHLYLLDKPLNSDHV